MAQASSKQQAGTIRNELQSLSFEGIKTMPAKSNVLLIIWWSGDNATYYDISQAVRLGRRQRVPGQDAVPPHDVTVPRAEAVYRTAAH